NNAGLFDISHMGEIRVSGPQAGEALDYALVGHASAIKPGRARYTMICNAEGGVLDDLIVYRLEEQEFLIVANAANAGVVHGELVERASGFTATVTDASDQYALIALQGPEAVAILGPLTDTDLDQVKYFAAYSAQVAGKQVLLARTGYTGEDGFELFVAPDDAEALWQALTEAGRERGLQPCGLSCRDTLRLEAGMPLYGHELSSEVTPYHANLGRVVKLDKPGDFVGKKALAEAAQQPTGKTLVGLVTEQRRAPRQQPPAKTRVAPVTEQRRARRHGYRVLDPEGTEIGVVTSGAPSPTLGHPIAMAYVNRDFRDPGTALQVDVRGKAMAVEVVELPFYRRKA